MAYGCRERYAAASNSIITGSRRSEMRRTIRSIRHDFPNNRPVPHRSLPIGLTALSERTPTRHWATESLPDRRSRQKRHTWRNNVLSKQTGCIQQVSCFGRGRDCRVAGVRRKHMFLVWHAHHRPQKPHETVTGNAGISKTQCKHCLIRTVQQF